MTLYTPSIQLVAHATRDDNKTRIVRYLGVDLHVRNGDAVIPGTTVSVLSHPSKMPGPSWGIAAMVACPGMHFGKNAICGIDASHMACYATQNAYSWDSCILAYVARFLWAKTAMKTPESRANWVRYMVASIHRATRKVKYFRVHDSGDMFSADYADCWATIAFHLPDVNFWVPTRSYRLPHMTASLELLNVLPNVQVKPSALHFGDLPPVVSGLSGGTSAAPIGYNCPASDQDGHCGDCRRCWTPKETVYAYHGRDVHGIAVDKKHTKGASKGDRNARVAGFMLEWGQFFKAQTV